MIRVAAFTGGKAVPSARFRIRQYIRPLAKLGLAIDEYAASFGSYPPKTNWLRPAWGLATIASRLPAVAFSHRYDVTLIQREMVSTYSTAERFTGRPRVWDVDDAIWLDQRGQAAKKIARQCDRVICGNQFIANWASSHNPDVMMLPTAVDTDRFQPRTYKERTGGQIVIGWMGQSSGHRYLRGISEAIRRISETHKNVVFRIVSDRPPSAGLLARCNVDFIRWSADMEVDWLQSFDIGVMPLEASSWCLGKCSYKMLLYMSCAVPVMVSDVGMNAEVLRHGPAGYGARNVDEWIQGLESLIQSPILRGEMGMTGRRVVQEHYSMRVLAPRFAEMLGKSAREIPLPACKAV